MLNIKDPEAHRMAKELAELEHTSMTSAVISALRQALDEHGRQRSRRRMVLEGLISSARAAGTPPATDPFDELYDDLGLPR